MTNFISFENVLRALPILDISISSYHIVKISSLVQILDISATICYSDIDCKHADVLNVILLYQHILPF